MNGFRVLVVENDPFTLTSLVNALEYQRFQVVPQLVGASRAPMQHRSSPAKELPQLTEIRLDSFRQG